VWLKIDMKDKTGDTDRPGGPWAFLRPPAGFLGLLGARRIQVDS